MAYIDIPIETEPLDLAEEAFSYLETTVPGWLPAPANLEAWVIEALAQIASELRVLAQLVPDAIFEYFGQSVLGLAPYQAVQASGLTGWTMRDTAGYTVESGTLLGITPSASSETYAYEVVDDFTVASGQTVAQHVTVRALEAGLDASGITGTVQLLDQLDFVESVVLEGPTSGGSAAEASDDYLNRLSDLMTLLSPRPILPQDFALLAQANPSVARATAIDLYNLQTATANVPRCVTVIVADAAGNAVPAQVKADVDASLQAQREVNFLVFVGDPTYTAIDVTFQVKAYAGYLPADVAALVVANLTAWLSPGNWGMPPYGDPGSTSGWLNTTTVRYLEVAEQVNRTDGVDYIVDLKIRAAGGALGTADVVMSGVAPLPRPGSITGTAS